MSSYQVFARKYRPQTFADVVGQDHITRTLKNAIEGNRLAHAYLFVGPRGTGKTSTARILAKCLCCVKAPTVEPCGVCDPCKEIAGGISLDVLEIDGASNNGVDQVRDLRDQVRYAPARGKYKIYIIDEVHMLTPAAFNALLKTLEEPPEHVKFVFATTEVQKVLPTILSRCQRFDLRRIPAPLIAAHLQKISTNEKITLSPDAAEAVARGAEGGLRDAESMLDQLVAFCGNTIGLDDVLGIFGFTAPETVSRLAGGVLSRDTPAALAVLDEQSEAGKDLMRLMGELITHLRNLLVFQVNPISAQAEGMTEVFAVQSPLIVTERLLELIDGFAVAENRMKWAPNKKLHFEIALIKAVQNLGQSTLTEVIDVLTALRENSPAPSVNGSTRPAPTAKEAAPTAIKATASAPATTVVSRPETPAPARRMDFSALKRSVTGPEAAVAEPSGPAADPTAPPPASASSTTAPAAGVATDDAPLDGQRIWNELIREIKSQRPLIISWLQAGRLLGAEGHQLRVGFAPNQRLFVESLNKANNRKLLEATLAKLAGRPVVLKLETLDEVPPASPASADEGEADFSDALPARRMPSSDPEDPAVDPAESFKNDPMIQKALKIFGGEIRSVDRPA